MIEIAAYTLQVLMIIIALAVVFHKKNFTIIILIASFGLVAAGLYIINRAPDVAIAEVAIGSAIIPLIYVISISRQREFIVLDKVRKGFVDPDEDLTGEVYDILNEFVKDFDLRLNVCCDIRGSEEQLTNQLNVDMIITYNEKKDMYIIKGKSSNILMARLAKLVKDNPRIDVEVFKEGDSLD
jgi:putative multicomponent Na+:H+ antiporter subunit B